MVFDEIDAGIGGQTAHAVGETLRRLAERRRSSRSPICRRSRASPTATSASRRSPATRSHARIEALDADARREELERMLGGKEPLSLLAEGRDA